MCVLVCMYVCERDRAVFARVACSAFLTARVQCGVRVACVELGVHVELVGNEGASHQATVEVECVRSHLTCVLC